MTDYAPTDAKSQASLFAKMAKVLGAMKRLEKSGWNDFHKYKFASEADVADAVRAAMAENNLALFVNIVKVIRKDTGRTTRGGFPILNTFVKVEFTFADGDTGATRSCLFDGEALDSDDKGINKAVTAAEKYFLLKTFMISSGDKEADPDHATTEGDEPPMKKATPKNITRIDTDRAKELLGTGDKTKERRIGEATRPTWDTPNVLEQLRNWCLSYQEITSDDDIAKLALIAKFTDIEEWRKTYTTPDDAFRFIKLSIKSPAVKA